MNFDYSIKFQQGDLSTKKDDQNTQRSDYELQNSYYDQNLYGPLSNQMNNHSRNNYNDDQFQQNKRSSSQKSEKYDRNDIQNGEIQNLNANSTDKSINRVQKKDAQDATSGNQKLKREMQETINENEEEKSQIVIQENANFEDNNQFQQFIGHNLINESQNQNLNFYFQTYQNFQCDLQNSERDQRENITQQSHNQQLRNNIQLQSNSNHQHNQIIKNNGFERQSSVKQMHPRKTSEQINNNDIINIQSQQDTHNQFQNKDNNLYQSGINQTSQEGIQDQYCFQGINTIESQQKMQQNPYIYEQQTQNNSKSSTNKKNLVLKRQYFDVEPSKVLENQQKNRGYQSNDEKQEMCKYNLQYGVCESQSNQFKQSKSQFQYQGQEEEEEKEQKMNNQFSYGMNSLQKNTKDLIFTNNQNNNKFYDDDNQSTQLLKEVDNFQFQQSQEPDQQDQEKQKLQVQLECKYDHEFQNLIYKYTDPNYSKQLKQKIEFNNQKEYLQEMLNCQLENETKYIRNQKDNFKQAQVFPFNFKIRKIKFEEQGLIVQGIAEFKQDINLKQYINNNLVINQNKNEFTSQILSFSKNCNDNINDSKDFESENNDEEEENSFANLGLNYAEQNKQPQNKKDQKTYNIKMKVHINQINGIPIILQFYSQQESRQKLELILFQIHSKEIKNNFFILKSLIDDDSKNNSIERIIKNYNQMDKNTNNEFELPNYSFLKDIDKKIFFNCIEQKANSLNDSYDLNQSQIECIKFMLTRSVALIQNPKIFNQIKQKEDIQDNLNQQNNRQQFQGKQNKNNNLKKNNINQNQKFNDDLFFNFQTQFEALKILLNFYSRQEKRKPILIICSNNQVIQQYKFKLLQYQGIYEFSSKYLESEKTLKFNSLYRLSKIIEKEKQKNPQKFTNKIKDINDTWKFLIKYKSKMVQRVIKLQELKAFQDQFNQQEKVQKINFSSKITQLLINEYFKDATDNVRSDKIELEEKIFDSWSQLDLNSQKIKEIIKIDLTDQQIKIIDYNLNQLREQKKFYDKNFNSDYFRIIPVIFNLEGKQLDNSPESFSEFFNSFQKLSQINYYHMMSILDFIFFYQAKNSLTKFFQKFESSILDDQKSLTEYIVSNLNKQDVILATVEESIIHYQALKNINPEIIIVDETLVQKKEYQTTHIISSFQPKHLIYFGDLFQLKLIPSSNQLEISGRNIFNQFERLEKLHFPFFQIIKQINNNTLQVFDDEYDDKELKSFNKVEIFQYEFEISSQYIIIIESIKQQKQYISDLMSKIIQQRNENNNQNKENSLKLETIYYNKNNDFLIITCRQTNTQSILNRKIQSYKIEFDKVNEDLNRPLLAHVAIYLDQNIPKHNFKYIKLKYKKIDYQIQQKQIQIENQINQSYQSDQILNPINNYVSQQEQDSRKSSKEIDEIENKSSLNDSDSDSDRDSDSGDDDDKEIVEEESKSQYQEKYQNKQEKSQEQIIDHRSYNEDEEGEGEEKKEINEIQIKKQHQNEIHMKCYEENDVNIEDIIERKEEFQQITNKKNKKKEKLSKQKQRNNILPNEFTNQNGDDDSYESEEEISYDKEYEQAFKNAKQSFKDILYQKEHSIFVKNLVLLEENLIKLIRQNKFLLQKLDYVLLCFIDIQDQNTETASIDEQQINYYIQEFQQKINTASINEQQTIIDLQEFYQNILQTQCNFKVFKNSRIIELIDISGKHLEQQQFKIHDDDQKVFQNNQRKIKRLNLAKEYKTQIIDFYWVIIQFLLQGFKYYKVLYEINNLSVKIKYKKDNFEDIKFSYEQINCKENKQSDDIQNLNSYFKEIFAQEYVPFIFILTYSKDNGWNFQQFSVEDNFFELKQQFSLAFILVQNNNNDEQIQNNNNQNEIKKNKDKIQELNQIMKLNSETLKSIGIVSIINNI
ncbi:hypothetical protein TTHERM_00227090 (macronuclear) [Tetrahymena thermophila SB210]|uniref:AAA domain protein n=1 Tax=Tetrahymena thermophila (strain SB210) TaxID=312017 RepID=Q23BX3_TETTS|nr:hypothetical protein TTHERM_00227090 [Tetrahymena thermophila SB210]EAR93995.2 hypothetical protein TTHERM_00227090 [Tetrahymena thermophila SB210]|eukprot:XP_001014240.2 hypothetical protein TTHERM_00227090 [Tetrahymena thermophila SB210]